MASDRAPLGILGGTFDPIHFGHLHLADTARAALALDRVRFIPAGAPAHRTPPHATAADRLAMVECAIADNPAFEVDPREVQATRPSYTVPTLEALRAELGAARSLVLLMGLDAFLGLATWHRWHELFDLAHIAIANRPGYTLDAATLPAPLADHYQRRHSDAGALKTRPAGCITHFDITPLAISATGLRALLGRGGSARYLCPDAVLHYIAAHSLYR